jgi:hypothetical protein
MLTPGIRAPVVSETVPVIVPRSLWAKSEREANNKQSKILSECMSTFLFQDNATEKHFRALQICTDDVWSRVYAG